MAYNSSSAEDRLSAVRDAIAKVLCSQEYGAGSRRNRYADLRTLRDMERQLMQEVASASAGGMGFQIGVKVPAS